MDYLERSIDSVQEPVGRAHRCQSPQVVLGVEVVLRDEL